MSHLNLNPKERELVEAMARDQHGKGSRIGFYASVLVPIIAFGSYGVVHKDFVAVAIALGGLLSFVLWRLFSEISLVDEHKAVFMKISEHEKAESRASVSCDRHTADGAGGD